jgi:N-acetylglucosaminyl-diphospho-decaprenol L-rhamnosyltransferase
VATACYPRAVDVAVVIVTHNSAHVIGDLLRTIPAALGGLEADVVVVDNGSTDNTVPAVQRSANCRLVCADNRGFAAGVNRGVRVAVRSEAILVLNPDVRLESNAVRYLLDALRLPNTGIAAPRLSSRDGGLHYSLRREPSLMRTLGLTRTRLPVFAEQVNRPSAYAVPGVTDWATGAVLAVSRECFDLLSGFDESYFLYSEETDFCLRARDCGLLTRYEPRAGAIHLGGESGQSTKTHVMQIVNRVRLFRRRHSAVASTAYLLLTAAREARLIPSGRSRHSAAIAALFRPSLRPVELKCSDRLLPR